MSTGPSPSLHDPSRVPVRPLLESGHTLGTITDKISAIVLTRRTALGWWFGFAIAFALANVLLISIAYLVAVGVGVWGKIGRAHV